MSNTLQHSIDMRTPEQVEAEATKKFVEELNKLQEQYGKVVIPKLSMTAQGIVPFLSVENKK